ncbi:MAG TPA: MATE family efflux transporter [candidate division Zixibacteria bacterium]|nr:MATE family efflux transporter [candidate division Zixibacteria bacterium]
MSDFQPDSFIETPGERLDSRKTVAPAVIDLLSLTLIVAFDGIILGHYSPSALAGGGIALWVLFFMFTIFLTFVMGASVPIARHLGAGDKDSASRLFGKAMSSAMAIGVIFAVISFVFKGFIFQTLFGTSGDVQRSAVEYFTMLALFMPAIALNFTGTGILRSIGDSVASMKTNLTANVLHAGLAVLFVYGHDGLGIPAMGALGAGLALGIGQTVGFLIQLRLLVGKRTLVELHFRDMLRPQMSILKRIIKTGFPVTMEQLVWMGGQLVILAFVARIGDAELAAHQIILRLSQTLGVIYQGYAFANMALCGHRIGAKEEQASAKIARNMRLVSVGTAFIVGVVVLLLKTPLARLFTYDERVIAMTVTLIPLLALLQLPKSLTMITASELRARGDLIFILTVCTITVIVNILGLSAVFVFALGWGVAGIWLAHIIDEVVRFTIHMKRLGLGIIKRV